MWIITTTYNSPLNIRFVAKTSDRNFSQNIRSDVKTSEVATQGWMLWWWCPWTGAMQCTKRPVLQRVFHTFVIDVNYITSFKSLQKLF